jgi:hypothetical protein
MVCGSKLDYLKKAELLACTFCGKKESSHIKCPQGHFLCDACHGKNAMQAIEEITFTTKSTDPAAVAELMMSHPSVPMLGCEHAYITAGALMAALRNAWGGKVTDEAIREVFARTAKQAHGGYCGLTGVCGIVPAVGACFSVFLGSHCGTDREQKITMEAATEVARVIADLTGPSCCKAYVRGAIAAAADLFGSRFGMPLPVKNPSPVCASMDRHPHGCRTSKCPYFKEPSKDIFTGKGFVPGTVCVT